MKRLLRVNTILGSIALLALLISIAIGINAGEPTKNIRIIYTNDTLSYVDPCG